MCDSADGDIATTDAKGQFQLDVDDDLAQYSAGWSRSRHNRRYDSNQAIESGFTLESTKQQLDVVSFQLLTDCQCVKRPAVS